MIRPAHPDDADRMAKTLGGWINATAWMPKLHSDADHQSFCANLIKKTQVWVADCRDGLGFLALDQGQIVALYLPENLRNQGWGKVLIDAVKVTEPKLSLWTFQANRDAIRFYTREGFRTEGLTDGQGNDEKLPDAFMTWERNL